MSLIFFGTPAFAVPSLRSLLDAGEEVSLVVTQPDRKKGRGRVLSPPPVKDLATQRGLQVFQPGRPKDPGVAPRLSGLRPEFIVVVAYGLILPPAVLAIPTKGCVNVHGSLLPAYRGAAPIQWALINGDRETGVTTMLMDEGMDTGDILLQHREAIRPEDDARTLAARLSEAGASLLAETLRQVRQGSLKPRPQPEGATFAPPLRKEAGRIDWRKGAPELRNLLRGLTPWPGLFTLFRGSPVRVLDAEPAEGSGAPGVIAGLLNGSLMVGTGDGLLAVRTLQAGGRRAVDARSFVNGNRVKEGDRFD